MSERSNAPRSGGRPGERGRGASRDAEVAGGGARGVRQSGGRSDTRRSGMRGDEGREQPETVIEVDGTAAKQLKTDGISLPFLPRLRVAPPLPIRAPRPTFAAGVIALVLVGVVGILLINTKTMEQSFRLDALRENQTSLDEQQQELEQQLIQVSGPGNLEAAARQLGLVPAGAPAKIRLPDGKWIGTPSPGKGQTAPTAQDSLVTGDPTTGTGTEPGADPATADQNAVGTGQ